MTQLQRAIADRTGESPRTIRRLGFGIHTDVNISPEPDDPRLVVDCPFCGRAVPYPGRAGDGSPILAECVNPRCDVYFDFVAADVYLQHS